MPICPECGKKAGGFSLRAFNEATGRCDHCDAAAEGKAQQALEYFRTTFQMFSERGSLTKGHWIELESIAKENHLNVQAALIHISKDFSELVQMVIMDRTDGSSISQDDFAYVVGKLSLPEYSHNLTREILFFRTDVSIPCVQCGAGARGKASSYHYACTRCGTRAVIARCPNCSVPIHLLEHLWKKSVRCGICGQSNWWSEWNEFRLTLGEVARMLTEDQRAKIDPDRRIVSGTLLGGSGYLITPGSRCNLDFMMDRVVVNRVLTGGLTEPLAEASYYDVRSLQIGGRGVISSGGGWVGGGFGLTGIVSGVLLASALNHVTTRSSIETLVYFKTNVGELILFNNYYTPEHLRILLSPAFTRIENAQLVPSAPHSNTIDQLRELGELRTAGTITEEEFQLLKAQLINGIKAT